MNLAPLDMLRKFGGERVVLTGGAVSCRSTVESNLISYAEDLPFRFPCRSLRCRCSGPLLLRPPHQPGCAQVSTQAEHRAPGHDHRGWRRQDAGFAAQRLRAGLHPRTGAHVDPAAPEPARAGDETLTLR